VTDHAFIVLAYGESPFLGGALASLVDQIEPSRIIVATSTPNDTIMRAAAKVQAPVMVNPVRAGIGADWNFGLTVSNARFVTLAHQDDLYDQAFLRRSLDALRTTGACLCFTGYREIDDDGAPVTSKISLAKHAIDQVILGSARAVAGWRLRAYLSFGNPLPCSSVTYDRKALTDFRFSTELKSNLDWDAWWRLMLEKRVFARAPERLVGRRHNDLTETSALLKSGVRLVEDAEMFRRAWPRPLADAILFAYRAGYQAGARDGV
jgi:glycosyltransferase involved in cell wall biosynthesis